MGRDGRQSMPDGTTSSGRSTRLPAAASGHRPGPAARGLSEAAAAAEVPVPDLAFARHDHARCTAAVLARAEDLCTRRGLRMTAVRRRTLEILLEAHRARGAYEVLDRLAGEGFGRQPPVAYRALDFLVEQGLVHRIDGLNAFAACTHPGERHDAAFLVCRACRTVSETATPRLMRALQQEAAATGFRAERAGIEVLGLCPSCLDGGADAPGAGT